MDATSYKYGLVPPKNHGRHQHLEAHDSLRDAQGKRHALDAKDLTRSERMVNRIGRIIAQMDNVHVAVALDGKALVVSANKEAGFKLLKNMAALLIKLRTELDPFRGKTPPLNITDARLTKDQRKIKRLLNDEYTDESNGIEMNNIVEQELTMIRDAIRRGVIEKDAYERGEAGIYVITTVENTDEFNMHGELKITSAIKQRRSKLKGKELGDVFVGGTWLDCLPCNASHKIMNESIDGNWQFYTGGTHGGMYEGYRPQQETLKNEKRFEELTGARIERNESGRPRVNAGVVPEDRQVNYDSESDEEEDYDTLKYDRTLRRKKEKDGELEKKVKKFLQEVKEINNRKSYFDDEILGALKLIEKNDASIKNVRHSIEETNQQIQSKQKKFNLVNTGGNGTYLDKKKIELEEQLKSLPGNLVRQVKWNGKVWEPVDWETKPRSSQILEKASTSTFLGLKQSEKNSVSDQKEKAQLEKELSDLINELKDLEKTLSELTNMSKKLEDNLNDVKKEVSDKLKSENENLKKLEDLFFKETGLRHKDVSRSDYDRKKAWGHMDFLQ